MIKHQKVLNSKGEEIKLTPREKLMSEFWERHIQNALGFEISITTLTTIMKKITEQKFFQIAPADYLPLRVGEGAWSSNLLTYRDFQTAGDFATGVVNLGAQNNRLAQADAAIDGVPIKVFNWAKGIGWSIMDLEMAAKAGNWDLVSAKEKSRKRNWDLGIQKVAFLGLDGVTGPNGLANGLLNQQGITTNDNDLIANGTKISTMNVNALKAFVQRIVGEYRKNNKFTAYPTHFIIPELDYDGLASPASADFPIRSTLSVLEETFKTITMNPNFKILPLAYADAVNNTATNLLKNQWVLLNYDEESIRMDLPVDYTNTLAMSVDNFNFQNAAYGQFTGVLAYRPLELFYITATP